MRRRRDELGLSRNQLAVIAQDSGLTNFHPTTIARVESGERAVKLHEAMALASILNTTLERLTVDNESHATEVADIEDQQGVVEGLAPEIADVVGRFEAEQRKLSAMLSGLSPSARVLLTPERLEDIDYWANHADPTDALDYGNSIRTAAQWRRDHEPAEEE